MAQDEIKNINVETARLVIGDQTIELPIITGTMGEKAIDITMLRKLTGCITMDPGLGNTGICKSDITFMDGEKGILRYRGIPVEQLAERSSFVETAYLLINGCLPTVDQLDFFSELLTEHSMVHEEMRGFFGNFPPRSHPMGILSAMLTALRSFYPDLKISAKDEDINLVLARILSKVRTMAAMSYKISKGHRVVYPRGDLDFCGNFLNMMFDTPVKPYKLDQHCVDALNVFWILHADHEQNCSTSAVRLVGSGRVNIYAALSAGIAALWGPLHGGANQAVIEMLKEIKDSGGKITPFIQRAKNPSDPFRLMGFGHRVYKTYDPRALIMKKTCDVILDKLHVSDPLLDIAKELEEVALNDQYFVDHNLYPNVDFYSGIVLRALGIPTNMFTVMFAIGRLPGWVAQWREDAENPKWKLYRPRQIYTGHQIMDYTSIDQRGGCVIKKNYYSEEDVI
ncbi:MAG: citrate synthase [Desulfobacterales bacterium]|nr:citrate synthase [Desulfobacterales bacterium]